MAWKTGTKVIHRAQRGWGVGVDRPDRGRGAARSRSASPAGRASRSSPGAIPRSPRSRPTRRSRRRRPVARSTRSPRASTAPATAFALRTRVARLEALRRADSLGALLSSRVHVLPHQVGAAGRILADRLPRFVLADEVGLGKTVEAGLVFAGMRQLGIAERVLVVVPEHLAFQWLAELFHKFNALFSLLTPERIAALGGAEAALARSPHAIVSFEALRDDPDFVDAAAELPFDLLVVDEAHHLADDALHAAVAPLCRASYGVLLLTATPVRLDPREYFRLLSLVEPVPSTTLDEFLARLEQHEAYADVARALLAGGAVRRGARRRSASSRPTTRSSRARTRSPAASTLLGHLADRYSLSARLIRNRRVKVGAFTARVLRRAGRRARARSPPRSSSSARGSRRRGEKVLVFGHDLDALRELQAGHRRRRARGAPLRRRALARGARPARRPLPRSRGADAAPLRRVRRRGAQLPVREPPRLRRPPRVAARARAAHRPARPARPAPARSRSTSSSSRARRRSSPTSTRTEIGIFEEPVGGLDAVLASLPEELDGAAPQADRADARGLPQGPRRARRRAPARRSTRATRSSTSAPPRSQTSPASSRARSSEWARSLPRARRARASPPRPSSRRSSRSRAGSRRSSRTSRPTWASAIGMEVDTDQNVHPFEVAFTLGSGHADRGAARHGDARGARHVPRQLLARDRGRARRAAVVRDRSPARRGARRPRARRRRRAERGAEARVGAAARRALRALRAAPRHERGPRARRARRVAPGVALPRSRADLRDGGPRGRPPAAARASRRGSRRRRRDATDAKVGPPPPALVDAARAAAEHAAAEVLADGSRRRTSSSRSTPTSRRSGSWRPPSRAARAREQVEAALIVLRQHREVVEKAIDRARLNFDAAALVVP